MTFPTAYQAATKCSGGTEPGTAALYEFLLAKIDSMPGATSARSGTYNCRDVGGTDILSIHSEGRALDAGMRTAGGKWPTSKIPEPKLDLLVQWVVSNARNLGVQEVIYARRRWTAKKGWVTYNGSSPHYDHAHISQTREGAAGLTTELIEQAWHTAPAWEIPEEPLMATTEDIAAMRTIALGNVEVMFRISQGAFLRADQRQKWVDALNTETTLAGIAAMQSQMLNAVRAAEGVPV